MKINLQKISQMLLIVALLTIGTVTVALAQTPTKPQPPRVFPPLQVAPLNVIFKEKAFSVQITPTDFNSRSGLVFVTGTGPLKLSGTLTTAGGCCARLKVTISRFVISPGNSSSSVFKEQIFEMCGSQQVNITDNLNASEDDARFIVTVQNTDPWNKTTVNGNLTLRYPTADRLLTGQPNVKFDLAQGLEANRQFNLSPNTPGKLKVKIVYAGNARLQVKLFKPNQNNPSSSDGGAPKTVTVNSSGTEFEYDIQPGDIATGRTWTVNVLNISDPAARDVEVTVTYTVDQ